VSLAAAGFVLEIRGGQGSGVLLVVWYMYVIGVWCGKWVFKFGVGLWGFLGEDGLIFIGCDYRWMFDGIFMLP